MNISKFNKKLGEKIAKAHSFERNKRTQDAIDMWIEVSEMTIAASKSPRIESTYRNMLITRTQTILNHIKELKNGPKVEQIPQTYSPNSTSKEPKDSSKIILEKKNNKIKSNEDTNKKNLENKKESNKQKDQTNKFDNDNWIEHQKSESKASDLIEIEAPKDFKIVTPHDPDFPKKMKELSEKIDTNIFTPSAKENQKSNNKKEDLGDNVICFACGAKNNKEAVVCDECGVKLK
ncbi:MAG: hypothetical protein GF383_05955 [Candidatus Lokiarchaeota archaeon]|nr:hypothetical protein [Candidatus Lokiarchaeota archaeon]MBD3339486.1 hypothetical protein [Candidatus Lokiarchaeota archaeon]